MRIATRLRFQAMGLASLAIASASCTAPVGRSDDLDNGGAAVSVALAVGTRVSLQPVGRSEFLRIASSLASISNISSDSDKQDSTFTVRAGLADASCFSFESVSFPNQFLRHANSRLQINPNDGSGLYAQDATWCSRNGLSGQGTSFESKNFPGRFFRHRNFEVWLDPTESSSLYRSDASWTVSSPNAPLAAVGTDCHNVGSWPAAWATYENSVLDLVNVQRAAGATCDTTAKPAVGRLIMNDQLRVAARCHSLDMGTQGYFDHTSKDGRSPWTRIAQAGYTGFATAENIAAGFGTPQLVVDGWMHSPGHCNNIMDGRSNETGIGFADVPGSPFGNYETEDFGQR